MLTLPGGFTIPGEMVVTGPIKVDGDLTVTGKLRPETKGELTVTGNLRIGIGPWEEVPTIDLSKPNCGLPREKFESMAREGMKLLDIDPDDILEESDDA